MLRYAFRRLLWVFPSVFGVSLVTFFLLNFLPEPAELRAPGLSAVERAELRRHLFLDLPLFVNVHPQDVRTRVAEAIEAIVDSPVGSESFAQGQREFVRLGGAGLPYVLPKLDALAPTARTNVTLALAPVADRMELDHDNEPNDPQQVVLFWTRFWETRNVEFRLGTVRSAVRRFARYGSEARAKELLVLDTFILPAVVEQLDDAMEQKTLTMARRLTYLAAHVTGRADLIKKKSDRATARACARRWRRWWMIHQADYVPLTGASRLAAVGLETRYAKWIEQTISLRLGTDPDGKPVLDSLLRRSRLTLSLVLLAIALAYGLGAPAGMLGAWRRGSVVDRTMAMASLVPFVATAAVMGSLAWWLGWPAGTDASELAGLLGATLVLALVLLAEPLRQQRAALLAVLTEQYVAAAFARGVGPVRVIVVHGLRNAILPLITRLTLELPAALTGAFVLEQLFGLPGLGELTLYAVRQSDVAWLMTLAVAGAVWAVGALVLADVAYALADPRLRPTLRQFRRRPV